MFKACFLVLLPCLIFSGCYSPRQMNNIKDPQLNVLGKENPYIKDFGSIKAGEIARHSFLIKNESERILNIKGVTTSCGCTASEVKNRVLKSQESTFLDVKFYSKGYSGPVQQFIYLDTDSLDTPIIRFIIKANVIK